MRPLSGRAGLDNFRGQSGRGSVSTTLDFSLLTKGWAEEFARILILFIHRNSMGGVSRSHSPCLLLVRESQRSDSPLCDFLPCSDTLSGRLFLPCFISASRFPGGSRGM